MADEILNVTPGADSGAAGGGDVSDSSTSNDLELDLGGSADSGADGKESSEKGDQSGDRQTDQRVDDKQKEPEEAELAEFRGLVSGKLRNFIKQAPELGQVFKKYPQVQDMLEATMRRDAAMRELFSTVAEARALRDHFPNGVADVQTLMEDVRDLEEIDKDFETKDQEGKYPGHTKVIDSFFQRDRSAAIAMFRTLPKEWARLDKDSYNDVMGKVVGATFMSRDIPNFLAGLIEDAEEAGNEGIAKNLKSLAGWVNGYIAERPKPSEEEQQLQRDRAEFDRQKADSTKQRSNEFHKTFMTSAKKLQVAKINEHRVISRLAAVKSVSPEKREEIIEKVRQNVEQFLAKSPSFMKQLRAAHSAGDLAKCEEIQKAAWSMPWLLNRMVRTVMQKEVPQLVQGNREAAARRAGTQQRQAAPANNGDKRSNTPKGPYQIGGRWYKPDGHPFTSMEVLAGKHLAT